MKRLKRGRPKAEFIIGAWYIGIRPIERDVGAPRIGIRAIEGGVKGPRTPLWDVELTCPLVCAVAIEAAKMHAAAQPRRINFLQFIALQVSKD